MQELAQVGGFPAWRTRVSEARTRIEAVSDLEPCGRIEWNHKTKTSAYRYLPYTPLGPDAATERPKDGLLFRL